MSGNFGASFKAALDADDQNRAMEINCKAVQYYTNKIMSVLNPISKWDAPFVIESIKTITQQMKNAFGDADELADGLLQLIGTTAIKIPVGRTEK